LSGTTQVSRYQKGKTNLDFTEARGSEWQWHQQGHMQVCNSLQTDNHASTPLLSRADTTLHYIIVYRAYRVLAASQRRRPRELVSAGFFVHKVRPTYGRGQLRILAAGRTHKHDHRAPAGLNAMTRRTVGIAQSQKSVGERQHRVSVARIERTPLSTLLGLTTTCQTTRAKCR